MKKKILVIQGTTRQNRASDGVASWVMKHAATLENAEFELVDLRDWQLPFFDEPIPPLMSQGKYSNDVAQKWLAKAQAADGFLLITAEYNHSVPAVLKNALDYWYSGWQTPKQVAFISYGAMSGGVRAVEHLRQICSELRLQSLHDELNLPMIWDVFAEDGEVKNEQYLTQLKTVLAQF